MTITNRSWTLLNIALHVTFILLHAVFVIIGISEDIGVIILSTYYAMLFISDIIGIITAFKSYRIDRLAIPITIFNSALILLKVAGLTILLLALGIR